MSVASNDLSDLKRRDARGQNFLADFHNYAQMVGLRATKFGVGASGM